MQRRTLIFGGLGSVAAVGLGLGLNSTALSSENPVTAAYDRPVSLTDLARYAFVTSPNEPRVAVIDAERAELAKIFDLPHVPGDIAVSEKLRLMFVANPEAQAVTAVFLVDQHVGRSLDIGMRPDRMLMNPGDQYVAFGSRDGAVSLWDMEKAQQIIRLDGFESGMKLTFSVSGEHLMVVEDAARQVSVIDPFAGAVIARIPLGGEGVGEVSELSRSLDGGYGYVSIAAENRVAIVDLKSWSFIRSVPVGKAPGRPLSTGDGRFVLVPNLGDKTLSVLSGLTQEVIAQVPLGVRPDILTTGWLDTVALVGSVDDETLEIIDLDHFQQVEHLSLPGRVAAGLVTSDTKWLYAALDAEEGRVAAISTGAKELHGIIPTGLARLGDLSMGISNNICH